MVKASLLLYDEVCALSKIILNLWHRSLILWGVPTTFIDPSQYIKIHVDLLGVESFALLLGGAVTLKQLDPAVYTNAQSAVTLYQLIHWLSSTHGMTHQNIISLHLVRMSIENFVLPSSCGRYWDPLWYLTQWYLTCVIPADVTLARLHFSSSSCRV